MPFGLGLPTFGGFGPGQHPDAPVITNAVDGGDNDSVVVSITGSQTIRLFYRVIHTTDWTTGLTREGSGDITQTGLTPGVWYEFYAVDDNDGSISGPSNIVTVLVIAVFASVESALRGLLLVDATVNSLVSNRIYPTLIPQTSAMPAIAYSQIAGNREHVIAGPIGLVRGRFQFTCWAETYSVAKQISDAIRETLDGFDGTTGGVVIQNIATESEVDVAADPSGVNVLRRLGKAVDFSVWFCEAA